VTPAPVDPQAKRLGLAFETLGLHPTTAQSEALLAYLALLSRWNDVYNLTAVRDRDRMLSHHVVDCVAALAPLRRHLDGRHNARIIDVGSGAGLPGIVFGILAPDLEVLCVESVAKKAAFVRQAVAALGLTTVSVEQARVQDVRADADVVTARAYASLEKLAATTDHVLRDSGVWMAMKGKVPVQEIQTLPNAVEAFHVEQLAVPGLHEQRCLVWMRRRAG
jgi:16S rRNA (guanine527-N7)-methyltransferase